MIETMNSTHLLGSTKQLGNSDMQLTSIGFGAWAIGGGDWQYGWGAQEDSDSIAAIHHALDAGMNWIDTAAVYGLGHSEEVVGRALKYASAKPYVFTKSSMTWGPDRKIVQTMKKIRQECEASLQRLGVDAIDLYQIHWPVPDEELEEGWTTMADLQREGKVRWIGVFQLQRGADGARTEDRAHHVAAAAVLDDQPQHRGGDSALLREARHRRDQLRADALRNVDRIHEQGARRADAAG
jgi:aryl-alcohol dehydrogenase-like predicted oxidoreductase